MPSIPLLHLAQSGSSDISRATASTDYSFEEYVLIYFLLAVVWILIGAFWYITRKKK